MMVDLANTFGLLGDLKGFDVYVNGVPRGSRRRLNIVGGATVVDNPTQQWLDVTISGGATLAGPGGTVDVSGGGVAIDSVGAMSISSSAVNFNAPISMIAANTISQNAAPTLGDHLVNKTYADSLVGAGVPANIVNNVSITGPGSMAIAPNAGSNLNVTGTTGSLRLATSATGKVNVEATATATSPVAGVVGIKGDVSVTFAGAALNGSTGSINLAATAGNASIAASGGYAQVIGETIGRLGVNTGGAIQIGTSDGDADLALTTALNGTTITIGGNATSLLTGNASAVCTHTAASWALTSAGAVTVNGQPVALSRRVRLLSTTNVANLASVTVIDTITLADGDYVGLVGQTTDTQNGFYRYTAATTTLARDSSFDAVAEYLLGTTMRAYAGSANKGKIYQLEALVSSLPATWVDVSGSSGGGGTSIAHATTGTFGFLGAAGILSGTSLAEATISVTGEVVLGGGAGTYLGHETTGETVVRGPTCKIGPSASSIVIDVSGVSTRIVVPDAAGTTALTSLYDNAANSHAYTGSLTTTSTGAMTFTPSSTLVCRTSVGDATFGTFDGKATVYAGGAGNFCQIFSSIRRIEFCATGTGEPALVFFHPVPVTPATNAVTSLGAYTIPVNKLVRAHGTAIAWLSAGNAKTFQIEAMIDGQATAVVTAAAFATQQNTVGTCQGVGAAAPLATTDFTTSVSGRVVTFRVANAQGVLTAVNLRFDILE